MRTMDITGIKHQEGERRCKLASGCSHHAVDKVHPLSTSWVDHYCTHPDRVKEHPALDNAGLRVCAFIHEGDCPYSELKDKEA